MESTRAPEFGVRSKQLQDVNSKKGSSSQAGPAMVLVTIIVSRKEGRHLLSFKVWHYYYCSVMGQQADPARAWRGSRHLETEGGRGDFLKKLD